MRVALLGPLRLDTDDGRVVEISGARLRTLLIRLALDAGRFVAVDTLVDDLWGTEPPAEAGNALQSLVSRLRRVLPDGMVESRPPGYRLAIAADDVDVTRFERLATEGRAQLRVGRPAVAADTLRAALALWQGSPLAEVAEAPFAAPVTTRLAEAHLAAVEDRFAAELAIGRAADILAELAAVSAEHPLRERLAAQYVEALTATGRTADALAAYQSARGRLADELGVDPGQELRAAQQAALRGDRPTPPPRHRGGPPARLTSFVGRDTDLARAADLLTRSRLVTLVGAGGAGKTRLATELADRDTTEALRFAELAPVAENAGIADLAQAILSALDLRELHILEPQTPRPALDRLVDHFLGAPGLLVLDNCEHLIGTAAELADLLLRRCPALTILATSREPLAITGEALHWVGPLDLPATDATLADATRSPAIRLFTDRATAARPGFALDDANLPDVIEICRRLDGLPLALELAAARLRSMTPDQVAARLDDRFRLLTGGNRAALPRHRTLRGVVAWSWELLEEPERRLARRLATLAGGADVDSAVGVAAGPDLPAEDIPYLLASLVEKSLLAQHDARYRMLETVRAYGLAELAEAGETDITDAAFVRYFVDHVERMEPLLRTRDQLTAIDAIGTDHENVIAALRRAVDREDTESAARLVVAMGWYWLLSGNPVEAFTWAQTVAGLPVTELTAAVAGVRLASLVGEHQADVPRAEFDRAWADCERLGIRRYGVTALIEPIVRLRQGDLVAAEAAAERARAMDDPWAAAAAHLAGCFIAVARADVARAETELTAALAEFRAIGDRWGAAFALGVHGQYRMMSGDYAEALKALEEAVTVAISLGVSALPPMQLLQLGMARALSGDAAGAEREVRAVLAAPGADGDLRKLGQCVLIRLATDRGDLADAHRMVAEAEQIDGDQHGAAALTLARSDLAVAEGDLDAAVALLAGSLQYGIAQHDQSGIATAGEHLAVIAARRGDDNAAARLLGAAAAVRGLLDLGEPAVRRLVADLTERLGPTGYAAAYEAGNRPGRAAATELIHDWLG